MGENARACSLQEVFLWPVPKGIATKLVRKERNFGETWCEDIIGLLFGVFSYSHSPSTNSFTGIQPHLNHSEICNRKFILFPLNCSPGHWIWAKSSNIMNRVRQICLDWTKLVTLGPTEILRDSQETQLMCAAGIYRCDVEQNKPWLHWDAPLLSAPVIKTHSIRLR